MDKRVGIAIMALLLASCSAKKFLPESEKYFSGHRIEYSPEGEQVPRRLQNQVEEELKPDPVVKVFASRPGIWLHGVAGEVKKEKGLKHWLKYKLGDKPVYLSDVRLTRNRNYIEAFIRSEGFFRAEVELSIDSGKYEAQVVYHVKQGNAYRIDTIKPCPSEQRLCGQVDSLIGTGQLLSGGALFSKSALERERTRIGNFFRSSGYYYFRPDYLLYQADSTSGDRKVNLRPTLQSPLPDGALDVYTLGSVQADFSRKEDAPQQFDEGVIILLDSIRPVVRPEKIAPFITMKPGQAYSLQEQRITLRQLNRLDIFDFVNLRYRSDTTGGQRLLYAELSASPLKKQSVTTELNMSTTSNNFTGPGIRVEYNNRNLFKGGEKLRVFAVGRYETQLSGERRGLSSFELDLQANLLLPRANGFFLVRQSKGNVPRVRYKVQYRIYQQADFYAQSAVGIGYGYEWLGGEEHYHDLRLIGFDFLRLLRSSGRLEELLQQNILFRESFENQVIFGPSYTYSYAPAWKLGRRIKWYFQGAADVAGNIMYLGYRLVDAEKNEKDQYTLGTIPFSQFARLQLDPRLTIKLSRTSELVLRQNIGVGRAYQNSNALPFSRQFFVGGAQSMRAFQPRSVGPGTYVNPDQTFDAFFDQTGDVLAEFNAEYRFGKGGYFEGALFTDIGNVWLMRPSDERPGGEFKWDQFASQLAVATGAGLRLDLSVIMLRFDLAFPIRLPYLPEGERWVADKISIDRDWRRRNLLLNIAIGYPF